MKQWFAVLMTLAMVQPLHAASTQEAFSALSLHRMSGQEDRLRSISMTPPQYVRLEYGNQGEYGIEITDPMAGTSPLLFPKKRLPSGQSMPPTVMYQIQHLLYAQRPGKQHGLGDYQRLTDVNCSVFSMEIL